MIEIHQHEIENYLLCPAQYKYKDAEGFIEKPNSSALLGTTVHRAIERLVMYGEMLDHEEYLDIINNELVDYSYEIEPEDDYAVPKLATEANVAMQAFVKNVLPLLPTKRVACEETLNMVIEEPNPDWAEKGISLVGTPDLVTETVIFDWKTSKRPWKDGKSVGRLQAPLYTALANNAYSLRVDTFYYYVYERPAATWFPHGVILDKSTIMAALYAAREWGRMKRAGIFPATPTEDIYGDRKRKWFCNPKWCPAWNPCTDKYQLPDNNDNIVYNIQRDKTWE